MLIFSHLFYYCEHELLHITDVEILSKHQFLLPQNLQKPKKPDLSI